MTKTQQAKQKYSKGDYKGALRILRTFRKVTETQHEVFDKGYEAMVHPGFYAQMHGKEWVLLMQQDAISEVGKYFKES